LGLAVIYKKALDAKDEQPYLRGFMKAQGCGYFHGAILLHSLLAMADKLHRLGDPNCFGIFEADSLFQSDPSSSRG
jgi:hypothetical protein